MIGLEVSVIAAVARVRAGTLGRGRASAGARPAASTRAPTPQLVHPAGSLDASSASSEGLGGSE
eukprot:2072099-Alexandrium_andersonii.AAC.1